MPPNHSDMMSSRRPGQEDTTSQMTSASRHVSRSATAPRRFMSEDSWVEIASQPSSSSLSSIGDEIVTTGLNVQNRQASRRRRRLQAVMANNMQNPLRPTSAASSSQDEYDESSSESDQAMSSSNEDIPHQNRLSLPQEEQELVEDDDEDDTSTALGTGTSANVFTPQPNAFTHPPSSQTSRSDSTTTQNDLSPPTQPSYSQRLPSNRTISSRDIRRPSITRSPRSSHTPYNVISPSHTYQPDHDAALRASLSTLLSCAAAARGLPKRDSTTRTTTRRPGADAIDTNTLRMVPESELMGRQENPTPTLPSRRYAGQTASSSSAPSPPASVKAPVTKRRAARESSKDRHTKKSKATSSSSRAVNPLEESAISPTLMTWMVSAGVVILFSAISFSAGFVFGREVGRLEAGGINPGDFGAQGGSCGQEMVSRAGGLKRLRWSSGGAASIRA